VAEDNPVRFIEAFVDGLDMVKLEFVRAIPHPTGRPGYDPKDLLKLFIYGYLHKIRSSRRLENETHRNVELMWLLRHLKPDFKTIADFRKDNKKGIAGVFREFTLLCKKMDLFGCELIGIDGSKFKGVNSESRNYTRKRVERLLSQVNERIEKYLADLEIEDQKEDHIEKPTREEMVQKIAQLNQEKAQLLEIEKRMDQGEEQVSLTDPDSRAMRSKQGRMVGYNVQIGVDQKHKLIAAAEVTQARSDAHQLHSMSQKLKENLAIDGLEVVADKGYYDHEEMAKCLEGNVIPRVPPQRQSVNKLRQLFTKADFVYVPESDTYICPAGQTLRPISKKNVKRIHYRTPECKTCELRKNCTTAKNGRQLARTRYENQIDQLEKEGKENGFSQGLRRQLVEHPFGIIKTSFQFGAFLTKGLKNVQTEITLTALAYNFRRILNLKKANPWMVELQN